MTISVLPDRMVEIMQLLDQWRFKTEATRREIESLIGKLQFIKNCIKQGCVFITRMLNILRKFPKIGKHNIHPEFRKDVCWWYNFLREYNGTSIMWHLYIQGGGSLVATDASLHGCGAVCGNEYFRVRFPSSILTFSNWNITHLEMFTLIVALKVWKHELRCKKFTVLCDNKACVDLINRGRAKDAKLQWALRELAYILSNDQFWVRAEYINTKQIQSLIGSADGCSTGKFADSSDVTIVQLS